MKFDLPALIAGQKPHPIHRNQHHRSLIAFSWQRQQQQQQQQ